MFLSISNIVSTIFSSKIDIVKRRIDLVFPDFSEYFKATTDILNKEEIVKLSVFQGNETLLLHQRVVLL